jgi:hypothetical protein
LLPVIFLLQKSKSKVSSSGKKFFTSLPFWFDFESSCLGANLRKPKQALQPGREGQSNQT